MAKLNTSPASLYGFLGHKTMEQVLKGLRDKDYLIQPNVRVPKYYS